MQEPDENWIKFPRADFMKNFKKKKLDPGRYPTPDQCILEMVNTQLKVSEHAGILLTFDSQKKLSQCDECEPTDQLANTFKLAFAQIL